MVATQGNTVPDRQQNSVPVTSEALNVGCSREDSLNPFYMTTDLNSALVSLVFEPLFYVDDSFCAVNGLALSYEHKDKTLTVKLDTSAAFSDGVQFSSTDVVYSFSEAKKSANYVNELANITSAAAQGTDTVVFTLDSPYRFAADSLSFPIVKASSADTEKSVPLGTGLYSYNTSGENIKLNYNPYCRKPEPNIKTVNLIDVPQSSTLIHTLELGSIDAYFDDLSSGSYSRANAASSKTNLTNLVFLGMNSNSYALNSSAVRRAVYYSVNRQSVVKNSYKNYAAESFTPYHPEWHALAESDYDLTRLALDYSKAQSLMKSEGFSGPINMTLIVYSGNGFKLAAAKEIQSSLKNIGINVTVSELTWDNYTLALGSGDYDLYIGEIKLPLDMNMSSLFGQNSAVYGIEASDTTSSAYSEYLNGNISLSAFTDSFIQNMPFAPICFRLGVLVYSNDITPAADCDISNIYKNIYEWNKIDND